MRTLGASFANCRERVYPSDERRNPEESLNCSSEKLWTDGPRATSQTRRRMSERVRITQTRASTKGSLLAKPSNRKSIIALRPTTVARPTVWEGRETRNSQTPSCLRAPMWRSQISRSPTEMTWSPISGPRNLAWASCSKTNPTRGTPGCARRFDPLTSTYGSARRCAGCSESAAHSGPALRRRFRGGPACRRLCPDRGCQESHEEHDDPYRHHAHHQCVEHSRSNACKMTVDSHCCPSSISSSGYFFFGMNVAFCRSSSSTAFRSFGVMFSTEVAVFRRLLARSGCPPGRSRRRSSP